MMLPLLFFFLLSVDNFPIPGDGNISLVIEWLEAHGSFINKERVEVRESPLGGKGIFLKGGEIETGLTQNTEGEITRELSESRDPLFLEIPYSLFFHPFSPHLSLETQDSINLFSSPLLHHHHIRGYGELYENLLNLALALELRNESSFFRPYFNTISLSGSFGIRMEEEEIDLQEEEGLRNTIRRTQFYYGAYLKAFNEENPLLLLSREEYFHACSLTASRSFGQRGKMLPNTPERYSELQVPVLIPFFDMVNHRGLPSANRYFHLERNGKYHLRWWPSFTRGVQAPGSEQFISYHGPLEPGDFSDQVFYGFSSSSDCVE